MLLCLGKAYTHQGSGYFNLWVPREKMAGNILWTWLQVSGDRTAVHNRVACRTRVQELSLQLCERAPIVWGEHRGLPGPDKCVDKCAYARTLCVSSRLNHAGEFKLCGWYSRSMPGCLFIHNQQTADFILWPWDFWTSHYKERGAGLGQSSVFSTSFKT